MMAVSEKALDLPHELVLELFLKGLARNLGPTILAELALNNDPKRGNPRVTTLSGGLDALLKAISGLVGIEAVKVMKLVSIGFACDPKHLANARDTVLINGFDKSGSDPERNDCVGHVSQSMVFPPQSQVVEAI